MGWSKSSPKREVDGNTILLPETRKTLNRQPNFIPKQLGKEEEEQQQNPKVSRRKEIIKSEQKQMKKKETMVKINKTKRWFFEKINKIHKPSARLIKKKREKNQINKIRNEKGGVTTHKVEIQRITRDYYEQ